MYPTSTIYEKLRYCRYQVTPVADAPTEGWEQKSVYNDTVPCVEYPMRSACEIRRMHMYTDTVCEVHVRYVACTCTQLVKTVSSYTCTLSTVYVCLNCEYEIKIIKFQRSLRSHCVHAYAK